MNAPANQDQKSQDKVKVSPIVQKLQKITNKKDNFKNVEDSLNSLVGSFDSLIGTLADDIKLDIIDTELGQRLGKDMSEEDADKMLIVYGECSIDELNQWSLAKKRGKVNKIIEELGKEDCKEYDLATKTRVASLKNKLVKAVKAEVIEKIAKTVENKVKENNSDVEQKRKDLANTDEYKKEQEAIKQAQAEAAIRQTRKKRAAKRNSAINAAAEAGVSAALDNCVKQTRENILANFDNAVDLTRAAMQERVTENKDPLAEADEIRDEVIETIKDNSRYNNLPEIKIGSDKVKELNAQTQISNESAGSISNVPQRELERA